jgi:transposase
MRFTDRLSHPRTAVHDYDTAIFVALELSKSTWLIAVSVPGSDKASKYRIDAGDSEALLNLLRRLRSEVERR